MNVKLMLYVITSNHNGYRNYLKQEFIESSASSAAALEETKIEAEHHQQCLKENEEWNKEVALLREQRLSQVQEARRESILAKLVASEERQKERINKADQMVREEKVISWILLILKYHKQINVKLYFNISTLP
jgi:hypothetical protein